MIHTATTYRKFNLEATIYTSLVVIALFLMMWLLTLTKPDPPIDERGGGPNGQGKMLELAYAPERSETPSVTPNTQPEPEETPEETPKEEDVADAPKESPTEEVVTDNTATETIKTSEKKVEKTEKTVESNTTEKKKKEKKSKNTAIKQGDLFDEGEDVDGGGDPSGNSNKGTGGDGSGGDGIGVKHGLNGWNWSKPPRTDKTSPKNGEIVFNVEVDENGKVSNVTPKRYTVDYEIMNSYLEECYKLKFVRKNDAAMSGTTKGTITFTFKAK